MNGQDFENSNTTTSNSSPSRSEGTISNDRERMSRALGAAFLQHQVQQLERNLDDMTFRRDVVTYPNPQIPRENSNHSIKSGRPNKFDDRSKQPTGSSKTSRQMNLPSSQASSKQERKPLPIMVIDTSLLIFGLPVLKRWKAEGKYRIVIPLDVISTLDQLKTYPRPIRGLVRDATEWLDHQFQKNLQTHHHHNDTFIKKFSPQITGQESSWDELKANFIPPPIEIISIKELINDEGQEEMIERALESHDMPRRLRSILQCTLWQQKNIEKVEPSNTCTLFVFVPPENMLNSIHSDKLTSTGISLAIPSSSSTHNPNPSSPTIDHEILRSGTHMLEWAPRFSINVQHLNQRDLNEAVTWLRQATEKRNRVKQSVTDRSSNPVNATPTDSRDNGRGSGSTDKRLFVW
ncbi:hypothetical protein CROQUDRAFT_722904 [Cronartium quercuum f. sp. fusiforme G11]|uniref:PIN domain-containing protein n=1 Tax=Cronartium quercuum f. sp. fusiforme G11 TaxID=708437 RepID=A0A9P6NLN6_9BASI|nr:hypothetical protein CROQUDRAFT_722904 [Cronartium quercuum f. sp. fusiforme G11]